MPLLTLPREMIAKILMALAPDYEALCCTAQTRVVLRDMETTDKEVLWKHVCETLITGRDRDVDHEPLVMLIGTPAVRLDSKTMVRLNHMHIRLGVLNLLIKWLADC